MSLIDLADAKSKAIAALSIIVIVLGVGVGCYFWGNHTGAAAATAKGDAALIALKAQQQTAVAQSLATALKRNEELVAAGNQAAADVVDLRAQLAKNHNTNTGRITHVVTTVPTDCAFGPEFVGLCNDLAGLAGGSGHVSEAGGAGGTQSAAGASGSPDAGVRPDASVASHPAPAAPEAKASPADLLAWLRDYGAQCQEYKGLADARLKLLEAWSH